MFLYMCCGLYDCDNYWYSQVIVWYGQVTVNDVQVIVIGVVGVLGVLCVLVQ